jgi:ubiquinone/menaquinone biosynthesis C-methylase UbiE
MPINNTTWNRIRYGAAAPVYDLFTAPLQYMGFKAARRRAFELLGPRPGERLLIVGAGTGLDLEHVPAGVEVVATDLSPAMVRRADQRARRLGLQVDCRVMDGESLEFPDAHFDKVVLHLILAVMPDPHACAREVGRILRPGGSVSIFDKFVRDGESPSVLRRVADVFANATVSSLTRQLGPILESGSLHLRQREAYIRGFFTVAVAEAVPGGGS